MLNKRIHVSILIFLFLCSEFLFCQSDPLPSWNDGPVKTGIINFISRVTDANGSDFIPVEDRNAMFDNDGTLWPEQPVIQGMFMISQLKKKIEQDPGLKENPTVKAVIEKDKEYFAEDAEKKVLDLLAITMTNMTEEQFDREAKSFFEEAIYPKLNQPITQLAYKPQIELLNYLRANGFKTYICSGGTVEFMRQITEQMYGIPPEQVIGSSFKYKFVDDGDSNYILRESQINAVNDKEGKPVGIQLATGKRPVFVSGNVRSGGDIAMMRFSQGSKYPNFQILINHDDPVKEFEYSEKDNYSLEMAKKYNINVVSMKNDWNNIFNFK